jgi:hypothetical protein
LRGRKAHLSKPTSNIVPTDPDDVVSSMAMFSVLLVRSILVLRRVESLVPESEPSTVRKRLVELAIVVGGRKGDLGGVDEVLTDGGRSLGVLGSVSSDETFPSLSDNVGVTSPIEIEGRERSYQLDEQRPRPTCSSTSSPFSQYRAGRLT